MLLKKWITKKLLRVALSHWSGQLNIMANSGILLEAGVLNQKTYSKPLTPLIKKKLLKFLRELMPTLKNLFRLLDQAQKNGNQLAPFKDQNICMLSQDIFKKKLEQSLFQSQWKMGNQFGKVEILTYLLQQDTFTITLAGLNYLMKNFRTILPLEYVGKLFHGTSQY